MSAMQPDDTPEDVDRDGSAPPRRRRRRIGRLDAAIFVVLPMLALLFLAISDRHQVVPGDAGCTWVRDDRAMARCVAERTDRLVEDVGLEQAMTRMDRVADRHPRIQNACHQAAHPWGERAGRRRARNGEGAPRFEDGRGFCSQGRYHGTLIGFRERATPGQLAIAYLGECGTDATSLPAALQCAHAYGHLFHGRTDAVASLDSCLRLGQIEVDVPRGEWPEGVDSNWLSAQARVECGKGVLMEDGSRANSPSRIVDCDADPERDAGRVLCALHLPVALASAGVDPEQASRACANLRSTDLRIVCAAGVGASAEVDDACDIFRSEVRRACIVGKRSLEDDARAPLVEGVGDVDLIRTLVDDATLLDVERP
jgi:hypothetical protein